MARATRGESTKSVSRAVRRHTNAGKRKLSSFQREKRASESERERSVPGRSLGKGRRNLGGDAARSRGSSYCVRVSRNWRGHSALVLSLSLSFSHPCSWSSLSLSFTLIPILQSVKAATRAPPGVKSQHRRRRPAQSKISDPFANVPYILFECKQYYRFQDCWTYPFFIS